MTLIMVDCPRGLLRLLRQGGFALLLLLPWHTVAAQDNADSPTLLVIGDSISAAYGLDLEQGWVALLERRLAQRAPSWTVVNASISGDTSGGGRQRLPALLAQHQPDILVIELGGNDGLRGFPVARLQQNLTAMTEQAQQMGAEVLLLAMEIPPNFGRRYTDMFRASFSAVATETGAVTSPFILEGIATVPGQMQADGIHPTANAQPRLLSNVWSALEPLVNRREAGL